jgi:formate dehydrogenase subunit delta
MDIRHLVTMANQIGTFFETSTDPDEAVKGIARHLKNFWDPRMRRQIVAYATRKGGGRGLDEPVKKAILMLAAENTNAERTSA